MFDKTAMDRIIRRLAEAEKSHEDLHASLVAARIALESFDAEARDRILPELLAASKASYDTAHHIDRAGELWEDAVE
jgi:hypothetical protein